MMCHLISTLIVVKGCSVVLSIRITNWKVVGPNPIGGTGSSVLLRYD